MAFVPVSWNIYDHRFYPFACYLMLQSVTKMTHVMSFTLLADSVQIIGREW